VTALPFNLTDIRTTTTTIYHTHTHIQHQQLYSSRWTALVRLGPRSEQTVTDNSRLCVPQVEFARTIHNLELTSNLCVWLVKKTGKNSEGVTTFREWVLV
jgi:hypothetical protein